MPTRYWHPFAAEITLLADGFEAALAEVAAA